VNLSTALGTEMVNCFITAEAIDPSSCRKSLPSAPEAGAYVCFEGIVRNHNHGKAVVRLNYEVYETLALKEMQRIGLQASEEFGLQYVRCWHRKGSLAVGDIAVLIYVVARHRGEAFRGCKYIIDSIKQRVPIWKNEFYADGTSSWTECHGHETEPAL
jgi:molybdopterin synthase catalytic subunit